jgi:hypothetical protein
MHEDNGPVAPFVGLWFWNPYRRALANVQILEMTTDCRARHRLIRDLMSLLKMEAKRLLINCLSLALIELRRLTKSNLFPRLQYCVRCSRRSLLSQRPQAQSSAARLFAEDVNGRLLDRHPGANTFAKLPVSQLTPARCREICK